MPVSSDEGDGYKEPEASDGSEENGDGENESEPESDSKSSAAKVMSASTEGNDGISLYSTYEGSHPFGILNYSSVVYTYDSYDSNSFGFREEYQGYFDNLMSVTWSESSNANGKIYVITVTFNKVPEMLGFTLESAKLHGLARYTAYVSDYNNGNHEPSYTLNDDGTYSAEIRVPVGVVLGTDKEVPFFSLTLTANLYFRPKQPLPLPEEPVKEGYHFIGWYYDEALTVPYNGEPIYEDIALYPKFEINQHTVTFDSAGGSEISSQIVDWDTALTTTETPERIGYNFAGWYFSDGTKYENQLIKSDTTLTAHWEIIMCTVTFMVNGEVYETRQVEWGTSFAVLPEVASLLYLQILDVTSENAQSAADGVVIDDTVTVTAKEMSKRDKAFTFIDNNKWKILECVGVGVGALVIVLVIGSLGRKNKEKR